MIPKGTDAISPAPHHDIYSIEDLPQLIYALKEATDYGKPVSVKIAAVHNIAAIATGIVRAGADIVAIDGFRGGTGAAPSRIRDNVGIPIELALAAVDERLREEGIRNRASLVAAGGIRNSADVVKAIALGADAVYIGTSALVAMGCHLCQQVLHRQVQLGHRHPGPLPDQAAQPGHRPRGGWSTCSAPGPTRSRRCWAAWASTPSRACAATACTCAGWGWTGTSWTSWASDMPGSKARISARKRKRGRRVVRCVNCGEKGKAA